MLPANQSLESRELAAVDVHDGLVIHPKLIPFKCLVKVRLGLEAVLDLIASHFIELGNAISSQALGLVHSHVGVPNEVLSGINCRCCNANPNAHRDEDFVAGHHYGCFEGGSYSIRHLSRLAEIPDSLTTYEKFVSTEASKRVLRPDCSPQSLGNLDQ